MVQHIEIMKQCHTVPKNKMLKNFLRRVRKDKGLFVSLVTSILILHKIRNPP